MPSSSRIPEPTAEQALASLLSTRPYSDDYTNRVYIDRFRDEVAREERTAALLMAADAIEPESDTCSCDDCEVSRLNATRLRHIAEGAQIGRAA